MKALKFILAGTAGVAALAVSAPASAQYYPGYGSYGGGNVIGQVLGQVLGGGSYGGYGYNGYGQDSQMMVQRCAAAVTDRINRQGYGGGYGYNGYGAGGARVVAITSVERKSGSKLRVRGIAQTNAYGAGYGGAYGGYQGGDLEFKCNIDYRGYISDIDLNRSNRAYGYSNGYTNGYSPYGSYRRY